MGKEIAYVISGIIIAVLGGLLLLVLGKPIQEILTPPEAVPVAQNNEKVCPLNIYFDQRTGIGSFSVKFQNIGDDGTLFMLLFSDNILVRSDSSKSFNINDTKLWVVNSRGYQDFNFEIENANITKIDNLTLSFYYGCYKEVMGKNFYCKQHLRCCNYQKEQYQSYSYELLSELC